MIHSSQMLNNSSNNKSLKNGLQFSILRPPQLMNEYQVFTQGQQTQGTDSNLPSQRKIQPSLSATQGSFVKLLKPSQQASENSDGFFGNQKKTNSQVGSSISMSSKPSNFQFLQTQGNQQTPKSLQQNQGYLQQKQPQHQKFISTLQQQQQIQQQFSSQLSMQLLQIESQKQTKSVQNDNITKPNNFYFTSAKKGNLTKQRQLNQHGNKLESEELIFQTGRKGSEPIGIGSSSTGGLESPKFNQTASMALFQSSRPSMETLLIDKKNKQILLNSTILSKARTLERNCSNNNNNNNNTNADKLSQEQLTEMERLRERVKELENESLSQAILLKESQSYNSQLLMQLTKINNENDEFYMKNRQNSNDHDDDRVNLHINAKNNQDTQHYHTLQHINVHTISPAQNQQGGLKNIRLSPKNNKPPQMVLPRKNSTKFINVLSQNNSFNNQNSNNALKIQLKQELNNNNININKTSTQQLHHMGGPAVRSRNNVPSNNNNNSNKFNQIQANNDTATSPYSTNLSKGQQQSLGEQMIQPSYLSSQYICQDNETNNTNIDMQFQGQSSLILPAAEANSDITKQPNKQVMINQELQGILKRVRAALENKKIIPKPFKQI